MSGAAVEDIAVATATSPDSAESEPVQRADADPPADTPGGIDLQFRPDVEGLRAVAVVLVVLYHAKIQALSGGFVGVDVFFVISGFLITGLLLREHELRHWISIAGFYARRVRRILPAAMLVIIGSLIWAHVETNAITYVQYQGDARYATLFGANFHFYFEQTNYFQAPSGNVAPQILLHFWSLAVEEQFYFVWPTLVLLVALVPVASRMLRGQPAIARSGWGDRLVAGIAPVREPRTGWRLPSWPLRTWVLLIAGAATVASFWYSADLTHTNGPLAFYSPLSRAWELGLGAVLATLAPLARRVPRALGIVVALGGLAAIGVSAAIATPVFFPGVNALLPVLGAGAVIFGGASGRGAGHLLGLPPVRAVGRVSYGWYLLHYPPMILLSGALPTQGLSTTNRLYVAAATLAAAFVMYYLWERPIRRSSYLARRPYLSIALGGLLVLGTFLFVTSYTKPIP